MPLSYRRPLAIGSVVAALVATALLAADPFAERDRLHTDELRQLILREAPTVVAVGLDGEPAEAVLALVRSSGAREVLPPSLAPLPEERRAPVAEVGAGALLDGAAPASVLAGRVVVVDTPPRARARAAAIAAERVPRLGATALGAVLGGIGVLVAALVVARGRWRNAALALAALPALALVAAVAGALSDHTVSLVELALLAPLAAFGGCVDRLRGSERLLAVITPPLLRATARRGAANRADAELVGPALAELLDARGLMLLETPRGESSAVPVAGWKLSLAELRPGALDLSRPPWRAAGGLARAAEASAVLAARAPATVLPLSAAGRVEGWLLVAHGPGTNLEAAAHATLAICDALGVELAARRLRREGGVAPTLSAAAHALDEETGALAEAAARARTGLALLTPTGATQWKNGRFDEAIAAVAPRASGDLGRVVALFRRIGESSLETVQRLYASPRSRAVAAELRIVATATRAGNALLVELDVLDAITVATLAPEAESESEPKKRQVFAAADRG